MENKEMQNVVEERQPVVAYVVKRFENGDIDVVDAGIEGTTPLSSEAIYKDIEDVAGIIKLKRVENAAFAGVFRFYQNANQKAQAEAQGAEPTVE